MFCRVVLGGLGGLCLFGRCVCLWVECECDVLGGVLYLGVLYLGGWFGLSWVGLSWGFVG